jgi:hypothetical protein
MTRTSTVAVAKMIQSYEAMCGKRNAVEMCRPLLRIHYEQTWICVCTVINPLKPSDYFNILKLCILPTQCICVFRMVLTINIGYFPKQH